MPMPSQGRCVGVPRRGAGPPPTHSPATAVVEGVVPSLAPLPPRARAARSDPPPPPHTKRGTRDRAAPSSLPRSRPARARCRKRPQRRGAIQTHATRRRAARRRAGQSDEAGSLPPPHRPLAVVAAARAAVARVSSRAAAPQAPDHRRRPLRVSGRRRVRSAGHATGGWSLQAGASRGRRQR